MIKLFIDWIYVIIELTYKNIIAGCTIQATEVEILRLIYRAIKGGK